VYSSHGLKTKLAVTAYAPTVPIRAHKEPDVSLIPQDSPRADWPKWHSFLEAGVEPRGEPYGALSCLTAAQV